MKARLLAARAGIAARVGALAAQHGKAPLLVAVGGGLAAGLLAHGAIRSREAEVREGWDLVPVLVAGEDVPEGTSLAASMVARRSIPEAFVTSSVIRPDSSSTVLGQKLLVPVQKGDPLLWSQFEVDRGLERLSTVVQRKTRVVTIETSDTQAVGGWVRPSDHVDVLVTFRDAGADEMSTLTLLQNVVVVATGKIAGGAARPRDADDAMGNVSLLLLPEEAELIVLAQELGKLTLALRNPEDIDVQEERTRTTASTLLTGERTRALQKLRSQTIQVIRGTE